MKQAVLRLCMALGLVLAAGVMTPALAQDAAARCRSFEGDKFAGGYMFAKTTDAPTYIHSSKIVAATGGLPEFCEVKGYIVPQIGFALRLPVKDWNGKFLLTGCDTGYCGAIEIDSAAATEGLRRGYAVTTSDLGHRSASNDGKWAYNNLQGKLDFAYRATHVNAVVAKEIANRFYDRPVDKSYFQGCSVGGRQGLIAAQRFPKDFDGIIAGAPAMNRSTSSFARLWAGLANVDKAGKQILKQSDAELLHKAAIAACDESDGVKDGIIGDPRQCRFDPAKVQCKAGETRNCLTPAQVATARKLYQGPVDSKGAAIHLAGAPVGSELGWAGGVIGADGQSGSNVAGMTDWFRYMADAVDPGPLWTLRELNWDTAPNDVGGMSALYVADSADLRQFKARGGRMIQYHGAQDSEAVPQEATDYFEATTRAMGGLEATRSFYRLFVIPGMGHCGGGEGAGAVDYLTQLERWVEKNQAPDMIAGQRTGSGAAVASRPHFPYPDTARYKGQGDANDAASFERVTGDSAFEKQPPQ